MLKREVSDEIERQLEIWAGAYRNIGLLNEQVAAIDIQRGMLSERIDAEMAIRDGAASTINELIADIDDSEENGAEVRGLLSKHISDVVVDGFVL